MPSRRAEQALLDIRDNAMLAQEFTAGMTLDIFKADRRTFYAVARCLEIVSGAARRLPASIANGTQSCPGAPSWGLGMSTAITTTTWRRIMSGARCSTASPRCWPSSMTKSPACLTSGSGFAVPAALRWSDLPVFRSASYYYKCWLPVAFAA